VRHWHDYAALGLTIALVVAALTYLLVAGLPSPILL
jgi:hypothetical protein